MTGGLSLAREIIECSRAPRHHHHQCFRWTHHLVRSMRPVHIGGRELHPGDALLGAENMNVVRDEVRHWKRWASGRSRLMPRGRQMS